MIAALVAGSRIHVEAQTRRALITQSWRLSPTPGRRTAGSPIRPAPLQALTAARVYDFNGARARSTSRPSCRTRAPRRWRLRPGRCRSLAASIAGIELDVTVGYGDAAVDVPEPLRQAIRLLVAHWYENRGLVAIGHRRRAAGDRRRADRALPDAVAMTAQNPGIGELNRRLVLEAPAETDDGAGGVTRLYDVVTTLWAQVTAGAARADMSPPTVSAPRCAIASSSVCAPMSPRGTVLRTAHTPIASSRHARARTAASSRSMPRNAED